MGISPYICRSTQVNFFSTRDVPGTSSVALFAFRDATPESVGLTGLARGCTCVLAKAPTVRIARRKERQVSIATEFRLC